MQSFSTITITNAETIPQNFRHRKGDVIQSLNRSGSWHPASQTVTSDVYVQK